MFNKFDQANYDRVEQELYDFLADIGNDWKSHKPEIFKILVRHPDFGEITESPIVRNDLIDLATYDNYVQFKKNLIEETIKYFNNLIEDKLERIEEDLGDHSTAENEHKIIDDNERARDLNAPRVVNY